MHRLDSLVTIGEASKIRGVSIDTLRRWEKNGKLQSVDRTEGGPRRNLKAMKALHLAGETIITEVLRNKSN
jgi:predicted site-specific integrase-resolvase